MCYYECDYPIDYPVSYTHLDVYKRQRLLLLYVQVISRTLNFQEQPAEFALKFINGRYDFEDEIEAKVNRDLADSRIISLVKSIQDLQRESKKLRTESEEENENE